MMTTCACVGNFSDITLSFQYTVIPVVISHNPDPRWLSINCHKGMCSGSRVRIQGLERKT